MTRNDYQRNGDTIEVRLNHIEGDVATLRIDVHDNQKQILDIRLDLKEMTIAKKLVFATAGFMLMQVLILTCSALIWFLSNK